MKIKYRAWDKVSKEFIDLSKDNYAIDPEGNLVKYSVSTGELTDDYEVAEVNLYTGLKDKNGKEVYEGDIIKNNRSYSGELLKVFWQEGETKCDSDGVTWTAKKPGFGFERIKKGLTTVWVADKDFEIIGNIYETPELIK